MVDVVLSSREPGSSQAIEWRSKNVGLKRPPVSRMEVIINTTCEQDQTLGVSQDDSLTDVEGQLCDKPVRRPALEDGVENDVGRAT